MARLPQRSLSSQSLSKYWQLTRTTKRQNTYQLKPYRKVALINNNTIKTYLVIRQTEPGLVAFYDIWPWNGEGLFLQLQSPHGASSLLSVGLLVVMIWLELQSSPPPPPSLASINSRMETFCHWLNRVVLKSECCRHRHENCTITDYSYQTDKNYKHMKTYSSSHQILLVHRCNFSFKPKVSKQPVLIL